MAFYRGFSTIDRDSKFRLDEVALVRRDLMNHFNTRRGERLHLPNFGYIIWELIFDGLTPELRDSVIDDATRIVNSDPRVVLKQITVREFEHGFQIEMDLYFVTLDLSDQLFVQFSDSSNQLTSI